MGTCVIAADTLNEGYQSMGVWHEGRARMKRGGEGGKEERCRRESQERTGEEKSEWRLGGTNSWAAFQQSRPQNTCSCHYDF